jgi:uncharacterized protein (DUF433 family)
VILQYDEIMEHQTASSEPQKVPSIAEHIVSTPGTCGGKPRIAGTRIRVQDIYVWYELQGQSVDEIVTSFPHLSMTAVYAALAYFWDHQEKILQDIADDEAFVEAFKRQYPDKIITIPQHANTDPLPPG